MILLDGHSLDSERKVPLESFSVTLKERESTATMVPADMTGIGYSSWFYDDTEPGAGHVWRVKSISESYNTNTPTVQLEHAICLLKDRLMFGEVTPADITGNKNATSCTAEQTIKYILSYQEDWVLGSCEYNVSNPYKFNGDTLFDALETVTNSLKDAWWEYDTTVYPFRLYIIQKTSGVFSEMRCGRNIRTIKKTVDKSGMFTRFYPIGKDDLHIDSDYVEMNSYQYGIIAKADTDTSIDNKDELRRWAVEQLDIHSEPTVTIEVEGLELAGATGEPLDSLTLGRICRVPMPEFGTTFGERIVSITYPDKIHQPETVKVTLSNSRTDVMKVIADALKKNNKGGRSAAKQQEEDHAYMIDTNEKVGMVAEAVVGTGGDTWKRISSLIVDGEGIHAKVVRNEGEIETAYTKIDMNEERILLEAKRATKEEETLSSRIVVEAERITQEVTRASTAEGSLSGRITVEAERITQEVIRASEAEGSLSGRITVEAGKITQIVTAVGTDGEVTAASICLAINNGGSSATINANKIYLLGQTIANTITADYISSKIARIPLLSVQAISLSGGISSTSGDIRTGGTVGGANLYLGAQNMDEAIVSATVSGNTLTLTNVKGDSVTFSKATSLYGAWDSGEFKVTASPQGNTLTTTLQIISPTPNSQITTSGKYVSRNFTVYQGPDEDHTSSTGFSQTISIDASDVYDDGHTDGVLDGWEAAYYSWAFPATGTGNSITIEWANRAPSLSNITRPYSLQQDSSNVYLKYSGNTYAQVAKDAPSVTNTGIYADNSQGNPELFPATKSLGWGETVTVYAGTYVNNSAHWGRTTTITGKSKPSYNYSLKCTNAVQSGGSVTYTFTTTAGASEFATGTNYGFWRE